MSKRPPNRREATPRPFLVVELVYSMNYHGRLWTVGCLTEEGARRSFEKRLIRNLTTRGDTGALIAFNRWTRRPFAWTNEVRHPIKALDYFVPKPPQHRY